MLVFVSVWAIGDPDPFEKPEATPLVSAAVHVKVAVPVLLLRAMLVVAPLQIDCAGGVAKAVTAGNTVTTTVIGVPSQLLAVGVMVYVTVATALDVLLRVCAIVDPEPFEKPEATPLVSTAVHAKVVNGTVPDKAMLVVPPLHSD